MMLRQTQLILATKDNNMGKKFVVAGAKQRHHQRHRHQQITLIM
jgi:hypothetical protein